LNRDALSAFHRNFMNRSSPKRQREIFIAQTAQRKKRGPLCGTSHTLSARPLKNIRNLGQFRTRAGKKIIPPESRFGTDRRCETLIYSAQSAQSISTSRHNAHAHTSLGGGGGSADIDGVADGVAWCCCCCVCPHSIAAHVNGAVIHGCWGGFTLLLRRDPSCPAEAYL
jgi:hypothetical protein